MRALHRWDFRQLHIRLVANIQARVQNGELSERALARLTGISQPHMHHVLKGSRLLSSEMADQILRRLHIDLADLMTAPADPVTIPRVTNPPAMHTATASAECRMVGLLNGWIGGGHPFPQKTGTDHYPFLAAVVERLEAPVAARLAPDSTGHAVVLLDRGPRACREPDERGYFALDLGGAGAIGLLRRRQGLLYFRTNHADSWKPLSNPQRDAPIRGRVSLVVSDLWH